MRFEILLDNDKNACDKARKDIEQQFITTNYSENKDYPKFGNFVEVDGGDMSWDDAWKVTEELMKMDGVVEVDPEADQDDLEEPISDQFRKESKERLGAMDGFPDADWYHKDIFFQEAIEATIDANKRGEGQFDGSNRIKVAQLDTGYTVHPEVNNYLINDGHNFLKKEDPNIALDKLQNTSPVPIYWGGHGTSCAGVMIGKQSTLSLIDPKLDDDLILEDRVNGVFPNIDLVPFRISRSILSFTNKMAKAFDLIIDRGDIPIVTMSHATLLARRSHRLAIQEAVNQGVIIMAAAGSHIYGFKKVFTYPAKYPETIAVTASTVDKIPWELGHGGKEIDLCAPGYQILVPFPYKKTKRYWIFFKRRIEYHAFRWSEGSSFSTPLTACAAALWMLHHGRDTLNKHFPGQQMTETFRQLVTSTAQPFSQPADPNVYGAGILNAQALVKAGLPGVEKSKGSSSADTIQNLSKRLANTGAAFTREKELMHKTLLAKIKTEDTGEELATWVMDHASNPLKEHIKKDYSSEAIKGTVKKFVGDWYS